MYAGVTHHWSGRLVTPNLPGFGGTAVEEGEPSLDVYADVVAAELDQLRLDRVVLGGTSMGGYAAMAFCRRHGDRLAGLALLDTKASADHPDAAAGRRAMADQMEQGQTSEPLIELILPKLLGETTKKERPEVVTQVQGWVRDAPPASAAYAQRAMADRPESFDTLRAVGVPALVVVGAEDVLTPPAEADKMAEALSDVTMVRLAAVGHLTPVEAPLEVTAALESLMRRVDGAD
jgi:pimeloyl-ACP methyl ester carboxylesterase